MPYIDGFVASSKDREKYRSFAADMAPMFKENGALRVVEGWGADVPRGKQTDLYRAVAAEDDETVIFSWIEWPDKQTRDAAWEKITADGSPPNDPPFDMKRMIFGGFDVIVDA